MKFLVLVGFITLALATPLRADPVTAFLVTAFQSIGFGAVVATALAGYAVNALINVAVGLLTNALFGRNDSIPSGITTMVRDGTMPQRIVYGTRRVSGPIAYIESTGGDGKYLHLVIVIAAHESNAITKVYFGDELALDGNTFQGNWANFCRIKKHLGTDTQAADADLVSDSDGYWTAEHQLLGQTYLYVRLLYDQDQFTSGLPNISAVIEGRKVYDPRDASTAFSANPALCIRDFMFDTKHGLAIKADEWDEAACITLANLADEAVTMLDAGSQPRFECNAVVNTSANYSRILESMLISVLGGISYIKGQFVIFGAEYRTPTITLTESDIVGSVKIETAVTNSRNYNGVKGQFVPAQNNYTDDEYPAVLSATYEAADGDPQYLSVDFPFETNEERAQRNAKLLLNKSRQKITFSAAFKLSALELVPSDNVMLTLSRYGWDAKVFEVLAVNLDIHVIAPTVTLSLRETASTVYDWAASDADPYLAGQPTNLPNPLDLTPPAFTTSDELKQQGRAVVGALVVDLSAYKSVFVGTFQVEGKISTDTEWTTFGSGMQSKFEWLGVIDGITYDVRARVLSLLGVRSAYFTASHTVNAFADPPADVLNFKINAMSGQANFTWDAVPDLDLSHYTIRRSPLLVGSAFGSSETVAERIPAPITAFSLPYRAGTYFIRASDQIGNESITPAQITTNVGELERLNSIVTVTESTGYAGTHVGTSQDWDEFLLLEDFTHGPELILAGDGTSTVGWVDGRYAAPGFALVDGMFELTHNGNKHASKSYAFATVIGETYRLEGRSIGGTGWSWVIKSDDANNWNVGRVDLFPGGAFANVYTEASVTFVAVGTETYLHILVDNNLGEVSYYDDLSVKLQIETSGYLLAEDGDYIPLEQSSNIGLVINDLSGVSPSGDYLFGTITDLGAKYTSRVEAQIQFFRSDESGELFDDASGLFDDRQGLFDGGEFSDVNAKLQIALTDDDPNASPTWGPWIDFFVGDFSARGLKFKAVLDSTSTGVTPLLTTLAAKIDMEDREIAGDDIVSGAGAYAVVFDPAFKGLGGISISNIAGMTTGDTYAITLKSATGFTIEFKDAGGSSVSRTFGYNAKGYGKVI
ncbi:MAG: hypothetical protein L3J33_03430 [Rhodobacteraceae bacterium]|nr:hypothetical protein [Paracoccaceae bacterium]